MPAQGIFANCSFLKFFEGYQLTDFLVFGFFFFSGMVPTTLLEWQCEKAQFRRGPVIDAQNASNEDPLHSHRAEDRWSDQADVSQRIAAMELYLFF
jgi:hypothetical protein